MSDRSPTYNVCQRSNNSENVARDRQSRRELSAPSSRLPIYRRSSSATTLTTSSKGKQSQGARSYSMIRNNPQSQYSLPRSSQSQKSHRSTSSNKFLTPSNQKTLQRGLFGSDNRLTFSNKKNSPWLNNSGNKEVQKKEIAKEFNRIRQVLAFINCSTQLTKPVGLRDFVSILISLFNQMQIDSQLTFANYITIIPPLMKKLDYNGICSNSMLKTVNTMHSFPHVLSLLSHLCDIVDYVFRADPVEINEAKKIFLETVRKFSGTNICESQIPLIYSEFIDQMLTAYAIDVNELEKNKSKEAELLARIDKEEQHVQHIEFDYERRKAKENDFDIKLRELGEKAEHTEIEYANKNKSAKEDNEETIVQISNDSETLALLEEELTKQTYAKEDFLLLQQERTDLEETCQLIEEKNKKLEAEGDEIFLDFSKVHGKLKMSAIEFNADLISIFANRLELQNFFVPESGFSKYTKQEFEENLCNGLKTFDAVHGRIADLKRLNIESEKECDKNLCKVENHKKDIARIQNKNCHEMELKKRKNQDCNQILEELEKKLQKKRNKTLSQIDQTKLFLIEKNEYLETGANLEHKFDELQDIFNANRKSADDALSSVLFGITKIMQDYEEKYSSHVEEKIKIQRRIDDLKEQLFSYYNE